MTAQYILEKHPTPWKIVDYRQPMMPGEEGPIALESWQVQDCNGDPVIVNCTPSNGVEGLVDFINAVGPRLTHLMQLDIQEKMRGVMRWENIERVDEDELLRRINNLENRGGDSVRQ